MLRRVFRASQLVIATAATLPAIPVIAAPITRWTGAAGNNLWADPLNWDSGVVPDADTDVWASFATIDLGGVFHPRSVASFNDGGGMESTTRLVNGTLITPFVNGGGHIDIASNVTAPSGTTLHLNTFVTVPGRIIGAMDVEFATNIELTTTQTYTGNTSIAPYYRLTLSGLVGQLLSTPQVEVRGSLDLKNANGLSYSTVRLAGGAITSWVDTTVGDLSLAPGQSRIEVIGLNTVRANSLHRDPGGLLDFSTPIGTTTGRIQLTQLPAMSGDNASPTRCPVVPWVYSGWAYHGDTFVARDGAALRPLNTSTEYAPTLADGENVRLSAATTAASSASPNSLIVVGAAVNLAPGAKLTVASGGVILFPTGTGTGFGSVRTPSSITGAGTLDLGAEGIVYAWRNGADSRIDVTHALDVPVTAASLTKAGDATLALNKPNTLPGGITITQGSVLANAPGALGTGPITFAGGGLTLNIAGTTLDNALRLDGDDGLTLPAGTTTSTAAISGSSELTLRGGALRLTGNATDTGAYTLAAYNTDLVADRTLGTADTTIYVGSGVGTPNHLYGNGTILGYVQHTNAIASPGATGNAPGRLTEGRAAFYGSTLHVDLAGPTPGQDYDQLVVLDSLVLGTNTLDVLLAPNFTPAPGDVFTIIDNRFAGPVNGYFAASNLPEGALLTTGNTTFRISYTGGDGNDVTLTTVVPEPTTYLPLAACALALSTRRKRKLPG